MAWLYIFAKTWRADYHPWEAYVSLGLVVWVVYVMDRLLDASLLTASSRRLQARHEFHHKHRKWFTIGAIVAGLTALVLVVSYMSYVIYHYVFIGGVMVAGFFGLSMLSSQEVDEIPHTKNILAGLGFSFGTATMAQIYLPGRDVYEMLMSPVFICFAVLCVMNISAIDFWEHARRSSDAETKASDELALTLPLTLLGAASLILALRDHEMALRPFFYAILSGSALLQILNRSRARFSMDALRVLADVAILLPFLVYLAATKDNG